MAHLLLYHAPFENWRRVDVATDQVAATWAEGVRRLVEQDFPEAGRITLVMDNLSTHAGASLYKAFPAPQAHRLLSKLDMVYTPRHGSWLNMAEIELGTMSRQCLNRRLDRTPQCRRLSGPVAIYHTRRSHQASQTLSEYLRLK